jgi:hypothetical protein
MKYSKTMILYEFIIMPIMRTLSMASRVRTTTTAPEETTLEDSQLLGHRPSIPGGPIGPISPFSPTIDNPGGPYYMGFQN